MFTNGKLLGGCPGALWQEKRKAYWAFMDKALSMATPKPSGPGSSYRQRCIKRPPRWAPERQHTPKLDPVKSCVAHGLKASRRSRSKRNGYRSRMCTRTHHKRTSTLILMRCLELLSAFPTIVESRSKCRPTKRSRSRCTLPLSFSKRLRSQQRAAAAAVSSRRKKINRRSSRPSHRSFGQRAHIITCGIGYAATGGIQLEQAATMSHTTFSWRHDDVHSPWVGA